MKPWYKSKTLWLAVLAELAMNVDAVESFLQPILPTNLYELAAKTLPALFIVLRVLTTTKLIVK